MTERMFVLAFICVFIVPSTLFYAQDGSPPVIRDDETKVVDTAPTTSKTMESNPIDSIGSVPIVPESLITVPSLPQPLTPAPQSEKDVHTYEFKGTGRDIVIGAAVLTGWLVVAFLAANQRSE